MSLQTFTVKDLKELLKECDDDSEIYMLTKKQKCFPVRNATIADIEGYEDENHKYVTFAELEAKGVTLDDLPCRTILVLES